MKNQMKFNSPRELFQFIDCDISEASYVQLLRERGHIPPEEAGEAPE